MVKIITYFIHFLNTIRKFLYKLECFLLKFLPNDTSANISSDAYRRFKVHALPVISPEHIPIPFSKAKETYETKHNRKLVPVFRKKGKIYPDKGSVCPHCGATYEYLSFNNGEKHTQIRCKVCENTFSTVKNYS